MVPSLVIPEVPEQPTPEQPATEQSTLTAAPMNAIPEQPALLVLTTEVTKELPNFISPSSPFHLMAVLHAWAASKFTPASQEHASESTPEPVPIHETSESTQEPTPVWEPSESTQEPAPVQ